MNKVKTKINKKDFADGVINIVRNHAHEEVKLYAAYALYNTKRKNWVKTLPFLSKANAEKYAAKLGAKKKGIIVLSFGWSKNMPQHWAYA